MKAPHPEIFISATSSDLRTCRQIARDALLTLGCVPVEQTTFPPAANTVREMLREKIASCTAVVHIAGECYGAEPTERAPGEARFSYTQLEYEIARELKKPVYVFVCGGEFPYDEHAPEPEELRALQETHRQKLQSGDHFFTPVDSRDELDKRVHALQTRVEELDKDLIRSKKWLGWGVAAAVLLLLGIGAGIWQIWGKNFETERKASGLEQRLNLALQTNPTALLQGLGVNPGKLKPDEIVKACRDSLQLYPKDTCPYQWAMAQCALGTALYNQACVAVGSDQVRIGEESIRACSSALMVYNYQSYPFEYSSCHLFLGVVQQGLANNNAAPNRIKLYDEGIKNINIAIKFFKKDTFPQYWAYIQWTLGCSIGNRATLVADKNCDADIRKALACFRDALTIWTRDANPFQWATTQYSISFGLISLAKDKDGKEKRELLDQARDAITNDLSIFTIDAYPQQNMMAQQLLNQIKEMMNGCDEKSN